MENQNLKVTVKSSEDAFEAFGISQKRGLQINRACEDVDLEMTESGKQLRIGDFAADVIERIGGGTPEEILFIGIQVGSAMVHRALTAQMQAGPSPQELAMLDKLMKSPNVGQA
jgi:hypothetical protein